MKYIFPFIILLFSASIMAQEDRKTPEIISKLPIGKNMVLPDGITSLTFSKVITDSRCPEGVSCVWAGEIKFEIILSKNGDEKVLPITLGATPKNMYPLLTTIDQGTVMGINITQKPSSGTTLDPKQYVLEFVLKSKKETNAE